MDIEQLYRDFSIPYQTEGHKHCREGWVNTVCPFCTGHDGLHLGYDTNGNKFVCWRCGGHWKPKAIAALIRVTLPEAFNIIKQYDAVSYYTKKARKKAIRANIFKFPNNLIELQENHRRYLIKRNFDPDKLINEWDLMGTGVSAKLKISGGKEINYKHRIIIPFTWNGRIVSFDSRDITNKHPNKYMACPDERETIGHKQILYGKQEKWGETGICVEGPSDVWRLGFNAFATSGIKYTTKQVRIITKHFKRVAVMFDNEIQALIQANNLVADLRFRGVDAFRIDLNEGADPGSLSQKEANYLVKQIIK